MSIYTKIRNLREQRGLKQQNMADLLNINQATYNKIENAQLRVKADVLIKIAEILEVSFR